MIPDRAAPLRSRRAFVAPALAILAACQPHTRRALIVDLALSDPALIGATAAPWTAAGYTVEYRRFYPHLTRRDLTRYGTILMLGGLQPERWSDALDAGDVALLTEWVPRGGVLAFGYAAGEAGSLDRWVMNRWLDAMGAGITIQAQPLSERTNLPDSTLAPLTRARDARTSLDLAGLGTFPTGRLHPIATTLPAQALALAPPGAVARVDDHTEPWPGAAVIAASRIGRGVVIVTSRQLLGAAGAQLGATTALSLARDSVAATRRFLTALARWTRRPAEWAAIPQAHTAGPVALVDPPRPLSQRAVRQDAPDRVGLRRYPRNPSAHEVPTDSWPPWLVQDGLRIGWTSASLTTPSAIERLLGFLDASGLNGLATPTPYQLSDTVPGAVDGASPRGPELARLAASSVGWFPTLLLDPGAVDPGACLLDETLWASVERALRAMVALAGSRGQPLGGVIIALPAPATGIPPELCDASLRAGLTRLGWDRAAVARLLDQDLDARYGALLESGALSNYVTALELELGTRAERSTAALRRAAPGALLGIWGTPSAADWRAFGLARGLAAGAAPVLVWDEEIQSGDIVAAFAERGVGVAHAARLTPAALADTALRHVVFGAGQGFWIGPIDEIVTSRSPDPDGLTRQLRRFTRP